MDSVNHRPLAAIFFVALYAVLAAGNGVVAATLLQQIDIAAFTFVSFLSASLMFYALRRWRERSSGAENAAQSLRGWDICALNVTTGGSWILMYVAYANMEPAVAAALMCSVGPFVAIVFEDKTTRSSAGTRTWLAAGFLLGGSILAYGSFSGQSAVPDFDVLRLLVGAVASVAAGYFMTASTVYLKRLSTRGFKSDQVMAHRFYLLLAMTGIYALWKGTLATTVTDNGGLIVALASVGIVIPLALLLRGIALGSPYLTMVVMAAAPIFSLVLQMFDGRLEPSPFSAAGVAVTFVTSVVAIKHILKPAHAT